MMMMKLDSNVATLKSSVYVILMFKLYIIITHPFLHNYYSP